MHLILMLLLVILRGVLWLLLEMDLSSVVLLWLLVIHLVEILVFLLDTELQLVKNVAFVLINLGSTTSCARRAIKLVVWRIQSPLSVTTASIVLLLRLL